MADTGISAQAQDSATTILSPNSWDPQGVSRSVVNFDQSTPQFDPIATQIGSQAGAPQLPARYKELGSVGSAHQQEASFPVSQESGAGLTEGQLAQIPVGIELPSAGIELEKSPEVPVEVESWVKEVGQKAHQSPTEVKVVRFDAGPTPSSSPQEEMIVLPVNQVVLQKGLRASVNESIRWLSEWCLKIIKKFHGMVVYHQTREK